MNVKVRLFATLRQGRQKEMHIEVEENTFAHEIISMLRITKEEIAILLVNGRDGKLDSVLKDGDVISLFPPVGGG